jgi:spermidine/putrescine transport system permease protein
MMATSRRTRKWTDGLLVLPAMLWLLVFVITPIGFLFCISLWTSTAFGITPIWVLDNYVLIVSEPVYLRVLWQTLRIALVTTALSLLISYPIAMFLTRLKGNTKSIFVLVLFLPFWTSYVVRSFVWLPMLGRNGLLNNWLMSLGVVDQPVDWFLYNEGTVYVGLVYVYTLFMTLPIYLSLDRLDPKLIEVASDLGATPFRTFRRVVLPLTMPGVMSGCTMVFLLSCGAFVTPQLLGGPSGVMFGNVIASQFLNANNWALGAALSIVLVTVVMVCVVVAARCLGLQQIFIGERMGQ